MNDVLKSLTALDLGDGRIMVEQRAAGAGPVLISPATARPSPVMRTARM